MSVINYLFAETPSPPVVEELVAFFAGIGLPQTLAYRLYRACNPPATNELVRQLFYTRYSLWHTSDTVRRLSKYYDVRIKKHVRLALRENPKPIPGLTAPRLGVQNTATPTLINTMLELVVKYNCKTSANKTTVFHLFFFNSLYFTKTYSHPVHPWSLNANLSSYITR